MKKTRHVRRVRAVPGVLLASAGLLVPAGAAIAQQQPQSRQIEEILVTAERRQASISDTSISISAFDADFISDFGLRNQEDLQNYIPSTTIQPYDITIRGVGRTARTLGGDPGVATYFNGLYSEDFGIASTEGGLFDLERIEVLRGPQGTLYGRNAVGGAVNFISKRPTDEWETEVQASVGNFSTFEFSGIVSGPLITDVLRQRLTYTHRERDGYIKDTSPFGKDINNLDDRNVALALEFTPTDNLTLYLRGNDRKADRRFNGGSGTMPIVAAQDGGFVRDTTSLAFGWRPTPAGQTPDRVFTHPVTGAAVNASRIRPGVDANAPLNAVGLRDNSSATNTIPNYAFGFDPSRAHVTDVKNTSADSLVVDTNGQYREQFDHNAVQFVATWDQENWSLQYLAGYTEFLYQRNTDEDKTGNTLLGSYDFYVNQDNENWQQEIQLNIDFGDNFTLTTGAFMYNSEIHQRLDLYDPIDTQRRFQGDAQVGAFPAPVFGAILEAIGAGVNRPLTVDSAQEAFEAGAPLDAEGSVTLLAPWYGDVGTSLRKGIVTDGTFFAWDNTVKTRAIALFTQGTWDINEQWSLTGGLRYARDKKTGQERLITMLEVPDLLIFGLVNPAEIGLLFDGDPNTFPSFMPQAFPAFGNPECAASLLCIQNVAAGAIDPATLEPASFEPGSQPVRFNGAPTAFSSYLPLKDSWDVWTWRLNVDYAPAPGHLIYASATTGWKSGGYNLGFRSTNNPVYDPEEVLAFEVGYKGRLLDGSMQLNASAYTYIYDDRQTFTTVLGQFGTGAAVVNIPDQEVYGFEADVMWLATDALTLGANGSYTRARFDGDLFSINNTDPTQPSTLFTPGERTSNVKGNRLPYIPEWKFTGWANYTWHLDRMGRIDLRSTLSWTDSFHTSIFNDDFTKAHAFWRWDARASWTSANDAWNVSAWVNNITNDLGIRQAETQTELQGNYLHTVVTTDPRVYGMTVRWSWNQ
jgi:outer membrane receptor protein involved in Fe transport